MAHPMPITLTDITGLSMAWFMGMIASVTDDFTPDKWGVVIIGVITVLGTQIVSIVKTVRSDTTTKQLVDRVIALEDLMKHTTATRLPGGRRKYDK